MPHTALVYAASVSPHRYVRCVCDSHCVGFPHQGAHRLVSPLYIRTALKQSSSQLIKINHAISRHWNVLRVTLLYSDYVVISYPSMSVTTILRDDRTRLARVCDTIKWDVIHYNLPITTSIKALRKNHKVVIAGTMQRVYQRFVVYSSIKIFDAVIVYSSVSQRSYRLLP